MSFSAHDRTWMQLALRLARRGVGLTAPNPSVGCVIVKDGDVIGRGWTAPGGRPHAEPQALARAGADAQGATAYITLEPCCHHGATPPCTDALSAAQLARVVIATRDPHPKVSGNGVKALKNAGITVEEGLCEAEARAINAGFISVTERKKPFVTMKLATSLDGKNAIASGESQWITGELARAYGHLLRYRNDAILTGAGTACVDNPQLTCRLSGMADHSPIRILVDSQLRTPIESNLFKNSDETPVLVFTCAQEIPDALNHSGIEIIPIASDANNQVNLKPLLTALAERGITRLLVEAGGTLNAAFLRHDLVDQIIHFTAPFCIGSDGLPAIGPLDLPSLTTAPRFTHSATRTLGPDTVTHYIRTTN